MRHRRLAFMQEIARKAQPAPWHTRQAEHDDVYPVVSPVERLADTDRTLTGGYLTEEVREVLRTGRARHAGLADAARNFGTAWLLDEARLPAE